MANAQLLDNYIPSNLTGYDVMPGVTVTSRLRPEYEPLTLRSGDFSLRPEASQSVGYDDNVSGTPEKRGSIALNTHAALKGAYAPPGNDLEVNLNVDHFAYPNLPAQSFTNWSAGMGWSLEIDHENTVGIGFTHFDLNQVPTGIDSIGLVRPLPYRLDTGTVSYKAVRGPWTFVPLFGFAATRFENSVENGTATAQNRNVETGSLATFYEFAPQRNVVLVVRGATAQYLEGDPRPDYNDISVLGGLDFNLTGLLRFRALAGYESRSYLSRQFQSHASPVFEATVIWTPTGLTTMTASLVRRIEDANEAINTGYTYTQARIVVDHEYLRNVLLQGRAWIETANYLQGNGRQTVYGVGASVSYLLSRNVRLSGSYDFTASQQTTVPVINYSRDIFLVQLRLAL